MEEIKFNDFKDQMIERKKEGIVLLGCDVSNGVEEFIEGLGSMLKEHDIIETEVPDELWSDIYLLTTTGGRNDLAYVFKNQAKFNMGAFALWNVRAGNKTSWISDYIDNYADHH